MKFCFSKKKKFHCLEQRIKCFLSMGWILPLVILSSVQSVHAAEITETQSAEAHYINSNYNYDTQYYFRDYNTANMIHSANANTIKTYRYDSTLTLIPVEGIKELASLGDVMWNYLVDNADDVAPNTLMARLYNPQKNEYEFRTLATAQDDGPLWSITDYETNNIFANPIYAQELYQLIHNNDTEGIKTFMTNYLPKYYLVKLSQEELDRANDIISSYDELRWFGDEGNFAEYIKSNPDKTQEIDAVHELMDWGQSVQTEGGTYSYNTVNLKQGEEWKPMDRTISISSGEKAPFSNQNEYSINSYWIAKDGEISPGTGYDEDFSQWGNEFDGETVLTYDDVQNGGTPVPDYSQTAITVSELTTEKDSIINMSWVNTNPLTGNTGFNSLDNMYAVRSDIITDSEGSEQTIKTQVSRKMFIDNATLGEGTAFRLQQQNHKRRDT